MGRRGRRSRRAQAAPIEAKASAVASFAAQIPVYEARWSETGYETVANRAFYQNPVAYRCLKLIAQSVGAAPWIVREDGRDVADDHPLVSLLATPNAGASFAEFLEAVTIFDYLAGDAFVEGVIPRGDPYPAELWPLRPDRVAIIPGPRGVPKAYEYWLGSQKHIFPVASVRNPGRSKLLHLRQFDPLQDWRGRGPAQSALRAIDQSNTGAEHNYSLLENGNVPPFALIAEETPQKEIDALEARLLDRYSGPGNAGRPFVAKGKVRIERISNTQRESDFLEGMADVERKICLALGVPPVLLVAGESTYNNRESARVELWEATIMPFVGMITGKIGRWLSSWAEREIAIVPDYSDVPALALARERRVNHVLSVFAAGVIDRNEAREALGYDVAPDPAPAETPDQDDNAKSAPPLEIKASLDEEVAASFEDGAMVAATLPIIMRAVQRYGDDLIDAADIAIAFDIQDPRVREFLDRYGADRVTGLITETTRKAIREAVADGLAAREPTADIVQRIRRVFGVASTQRARTIARTEIVRASNFGALEAARQAEIEEVQWLATRDDRVRDTHRDLDGKRVATGEYFVSARGARAKHPGGFGVAAEDINCRCAAVAADDGERGLDAETIETKRAARWKIFDGKRASFEREMTAALRAAFAAQEAAVVAAARERI